MICRLCCSLISNSFSKSILLGREIEYFDCPSCGYVQTEKPTWLAEAYSSSINPSDTGIMARNLSNVFLVLATLNLLKDRSGRVVDYAGGHGFLVRLLRDRGIEALWADPYSENLVARGFEYSGIGQATLLTAFEAFEHFLNPTEEIERMISISSNILFTTNIIPASAPHPSEWWYYGLDHGQHIGFYRKRTFEYIAKRYKFYFLTDSISTHLFSKQKLSLRRWLIMIRLAGHMPYLFSYGLRSKTWDDYLVISNSARNK